MVKTAPELESTAARKLAEAGLQIYQEDAERMPLIALRAAIETHGLAPGKLAQALDVEIYRLLRRLAMVPQDVLGHPVGLVICDASGSILMRKPVAGFPLPRFGTSCPLWPLFTALSQPGCRSGGVSIKRGAQRVTVSVLRFHGRRSSPDLIVIR